MLWRQMSGRGWREVKKKSRRGRGRGRWQGTEREEETPRGERVGGELRKRLKGRGKEEC